MHNFTAHIHTAMIYKIRITLDVENDVLREVIIADNVSLEDLHNLIVNAFGFDGTEMASFYLTDGEWNQGEEIPLFDMSDEGNTTAMQHFTLSEVLNDTIDKLIYVYDYFNMWTFYVELTNIIEEDTLIEAPAVLISKGNIPAEAPDKEFIGEKFEDDIEDYDSLENFDDFNFDNFDDSMN